MSIKTLLKDFSLDKEEEIVRLFLFARDRAQKWLRYNGRYLSKDLPEEFATEIALECVVTAPNKCNENLVLENHIKILCDLNAKKIVTTKLLYELNDHVVSKHTMDIEDKLEVEEIILEAINGCSLKLQVSLLYFFHYGDLRQLNRIEKYYTPYEFSILCNKVINMSKELSEYDFKLDMYIPSTPIGKTILLSMLLNKYPRLTSLLILMKDFKKFFQFVMINEKLQFEIPSVIDLTEDIVEISKLISRMENGENNLNDLDMLKNFLIESDENFNVCESFSDFIVATFQETLGLYREASLKAIRQIETSDDISKLYETLNKQITIEHGLLKSINEINSQYISSVLDNFSGSETLKHVSF